MRKLIFARHFLCLFLLGEQKKEDEICIKTKESKASAPKESFRQAKKAGKPIANKTSLLSHQQNFLQ
jgi:hypothetical protein